MKSSTNLVPARFASDAGIAIGPILFIIAVLGILAAAIAAGSGSFTANSNTEGNRTKAGAIIEIGQNLKLGHDRLTANGTAFGDIIVDRTETEDTVDLFAPNGGGITAPSAALGRNPADDWAYDEVAWPDVGTGSDDRVAYLEVGLDICEQINVKVIGIANTTTTASGANSAQGDIGATVTTAITVANIPALFAGRPIGCIVNTNGSADTYWFYQVMGVQ